MGLFIDEFPAISPNDFWSLTYREFFVLKDRLDKKFKNREKQNKAQEEQSNKYRQKMNKSKKPKFGGFKKGRH